MSQHESGPGDSVRPTGSDYRYDDGLHVRVDGVAPYELVDPEDSYGYREGDDLVRCTLYLSNGTDRPVDVDGVTLLVRSGPYGKTGRQVQDYRTETLDGELEGRLLKGRRASATWAYSIPAGTAGELDIEVRFPSSHDRESVTFTTAVAAASVSGGDPRAAFAREAPAPLPDQAALFGDQQASLFTDEEPAPAGPRPRSMSHHDGGGADRDAGSPRPIAGAPLGAVPA